MSSTEATFDPRHPHEPEIPPTFDAEGRCLICGLTVRLRAAESERDRLQEKVNAAVDCIVEYHLASEATGERWDEADSLERDAIEDRMQEAAAALNHYAIVTLTNRAEAIS